MHGFLLLMVYMTLYRMYISPICNFQPIENWGDSCRNITIETALPGAQPGGSALCQNIEKACYSAATGLVESRAITVPLCQIIEERGENIACKKAETIPQLHVGTAVAIFETAL